MRIIAVMSPKGGIGKTTTSDAIAYMLGEEQEKRVLILDGDPQGDTSKTFEASDEDIAQVNKTIAEKGEPVVQRIMSGKIPKSKDIKKSGRGFGSKSSVSAHAADEIPIGKVKVNGTGATADVGWEKNTQDEGGHFYVRFINWGTIYRPPQEFIYATGREADAELQKIAEQEYQAYLDRTVG